MRPIFNVPKVTLMPLDRFQVAFDFAAHVHTFASGSSNIKEPSTGMAIPLALIACRAKRLSFLCTLPGTTLAEIRYELISLVETIEDLYYLVSGGTDEYECKLYNLYNRCPQIKSFLATGVGALLRGALVTVEPGNDAVAKG